MTLPRYIVIVPRVSGAVLDVGLRELAHRLGLEIAINRPEFQLLITPAHKDVHVSRTRCVFGTAFNSSGRAIGSDLADAENLSSVDLSKRIWGSWIALMTNDHNPCVTLYRSPSSHLACYYAEHRNFLIATSDFGLLQHLGCDISRTDWEGVRQHLLRSQLRTPRTAVLGVTELLAGRELKINRETAAEGQVWTPWSYTKRSQSYRDEREAVESVRTSIKLAVEAYSRRYSSIVLGVSGGLDSSIVAAAIVHAGAMIVPFTLIGKGDLGDERRFTDLLANHLAIEVVPLVERADLIDLTLSHSSHLPRPLARSFAQSGDVLSSRLLRSPSAAFFSGAGGDNIFCSIQSVRPIADRIITGQPLRGTVDLIRDTAHIAGVSRAQVAIQIPRALLPGRRRFRWPDDHTFLQSSAFAPLDFGAQHPWLDAPTSPLPGAAAHIAMLLYIQNHLDGFARERQHDVIAPLVAQPVVEACLRAPSWMWFKQTYNRYLARKAFEDDITRPLAWRRSKGSPDGFAAFLFATKRKQIREILNDGQLATQGLIDMRSVNGVVSSDTVPATNIVWRILSLVDVEAWLSTRRPARMGPDFNLAQA